MTDGTKTITRILKAVDDRGYDNAVRLRLIDTLVVAKVEFAFNHDFEIKDELKVVEILKDACHAEGYNIIEHTINFC